MNLRISCHHRVIRATIELLPSLDELVCSDYVGEQGQRSVEAYMPVLGTGMTQRFETCSP